jgi:DNA repair protein RadC
VRPRKDRSVKLPVYSLKLVRERSFECPPISLRHPQTYALFFHRLIGQADREHGAALFLDAKGKPTGSTILSVGSLTFTPLPAREVFKAALLANAFSVILCHNHPSNNARPSPRDVETTRMLISAGNVLGVRVLDHVITTPSGDFYSMLEAGLLPLPESTAANS